MNHSYTKYAEIGLDSIPRILSCIDRNKYSPIWMFPS